MATNKKISQKKKASHRISKNEAENHNNNSFPIVAIGASAGGLEAFEKIFSNLTKIGMAYIVITHLDREHTSVLPAIIKKYTSLSVVLVKNGTLVKPDVIYVIPPKKNIVIEQGVLNLVEQKEPHYMNLPIDYFFHSLAKDKGEDAIAIILSGSGSDGSQGLRDIKEYGGLTIVQDPLTASFDSMPLNAIHTGLIDYVMPAEEIPLQLTKYFNYGKVKDGKISPELQHIFTILHAHTGHDFSHYKLNTVCRRIEKQMYRHQIKKLMDYVRFLRLNQHEVDNLFKDLLIGVTRFFRDSVAFDVLKSKILPLLLKTKPKDYGVRVWVPACSTGEEAYSIAIILRECMDKMKKNFNVQIFGTDIDLNALEIARSGVYSETISVDVNAERLKKFFLKDKNNYKINKEIRSMVVFGEQNIIKNPPFTKMDLICCRNLLIYLNIELQRKLLPLFHYSLKPKGILFLGTSEVTSGFTDYFQLVDKKWKIFERKDSVFLPHAIFDFSTASSIHGATTLPVLEQNNMNENLNFIQAIQTVLLKNHVPPCIIINKKGDILYIHGKADHYLRASKNKNSLTISDHAYPEIKMALIPALHKIELHKTGILCKNLKIKISRRLSVINLRVIPITHFEVLRGLILVVFEESCTSKSIESEHGESSLNKKNQKFEEIVQELWHTKKNFQATIEELESGNEELQLANEELQSTNEEIETSKEELQSLNGELILVNTELQNMIDQLASVNDDMTNLFNSTELAVFFLDNNLRIKRFTPKAQQFIHLIQTDIGRSISHFSTTIKYDNLINDAKEVLKTLLQKNIEVESNDGRWYHLRILPYRTLTNMIDGVVITLTDITKFKEYENKLLLLNNALQASLSYTENIVNTMFEPLLILSADLKVISANLSFYNTFKISESAIVGEFIYNLGIKQLDIPQLRELLEKVILKDQFFKDFKFEHDFPNIGHKKFILNARKIFHIKSGTDAILLVMGLQ